MIITRDFNLTRVFDDSRQRTTEETSNVGFRRGAAVLSVFFKPVSLVLTEEKKKKMEFCIVHAKHVAENVAGMLSDQSRVYFCPRRHPIEAKSQGSGN